MARALSFRRKLRFSNLIPMTYKSGSTYESSRKHSAHLSCDGWKRTLSERSLRFGNARIAQTYICPQRRLQEGRVSYYKAIDGLD